MEEFAPMVMGSMMFLVVYWSIKTVSGNRRALKMANLKAELQDKMLDKFDSTQELLQYLQSEAGLRFLESATIERGNPFAKILGSIQTGIVLATGGLGCLFMKDQVEEITDGLMMLGTMGLALGIGFLVSGIVAFGLSKSWGLLEKDKSAVREEL